MLSHYLAIVTQSGDVFAAEVDLGQNSIGLVSSLGGAKIELGPQGRFMVTIGYNLAIITRSGELPRAPIEGTFSGFFFQPQTVGPMFKFIGAKLELDPQDRFVIALNNALVVVSKSGQVFGY